jgi:predicted nucleic acid-binding Zn ribbon protein
MTINTSGDNPVDGVDNSAAQRGPGVVGKDNPDTSPPESGAGGGDRAADLRGADLARAALESARASARARGRRGSAARGTPRAGRRRRGWSGARPDDRDPQPLGRVASRIAAERGWTNRLAGGQVFGRWAGLVGAEVAEHARPVSLQDGVLTVQAASTAWATQLRLLQRQLLARIAAGVGKDVVQRLKIQGPTGPSWRFGPKHVPGRGPRDTYG